MRQITRILLAIVLVAGAAVPALSQTNPDTSPPAQTGAQVYGAYFAADIDSIGLYNGNLSLAIPLFSLPGRELPYGISLSYNAQKWEHDYCDFTDCGRYSGGWQKSNIFGSAPTFFPNLVGCVWTGSNYQYKWEMNVYWIDGSGARHRYKEDAYTNCSSPTTPSWDNRTLPSLDSDGSTFSTGTYMSYGSDPARVNFKNGYVRYFRDHGATSPSYDYATPNGNYLVKSTGTSSLPTQDTLGRSVGYSCSNSCTGSSYTETYTVTDSGGTGRTYVLSWTRYLTGWDPWAQYDGYYVQSFYLLSSITLPNSKTYSFEYDHPQRFMTKVTLPSGAYIKYIYPSGSDKEYQPQYDEVLQRKVSADGTTGSEKVWTYSGYEGLGTTVDGRYVTVTSPEGDKVVHTLTAQGTENKTEWKTSANVVLKEVSASWSQTAVEANGQPNTPRVNTLTTYMNPSYLNNHPASIQTITYDSNLNVTQQKTEQGASPFQIVSIQKDITYTTISGNYVKPASETLTAIDPVSGSLVVQGKTEYVYDEYSLTTRSSVPNHNGNTSASGRGNLTSVKTYKDASNYLTSHMHYDSVGNLIETVDPLSHSTTTDFTDNFTDSTNRNTFAYPKKVTNALSQYATSKYDFNTGLVKEVTNLRGYTTTTAYDLLNRVTTITEPAVGGTSKVTTYAYDDTNRITTKEVTVDTSGNKGHVETYFDKLYRTVKTVTNDPDGAITSETEYDGNGRVKKTSNPYRSGETVVWTQTAYDALSRPVTVTAPDSSTISYAYYNNVTTTTDQAGNQRRYTYNALGQLTTVEEPAPTLDFPAVTTYSYYAFGPLYQSNQSGQTRAWIYNWLGQMTSQTLPESGTTSFTYDSGGRLSTKTDARSVVTTMTYDDVNRVTQRSYSDSTPTVGFTYDQSSQTGLRTAMSDGLGSVSYTYDTRDRLTSESRTLTGITGTFSTSYVYNVKGDVTQMTYPSGRVVNFAYATGGGCCNSRLASVADGTTSTTLLNSIAFNAAGGATSQTFNPGSNAVTETFTYNNRLQLTDIDVTKGGTAIMDFNYDYGTSSTNTGRVLKRTDAIQGEHTAVYGYDSLYRLVQAAGADSSWAVSWGLDTWGNRTSQTPAGLSTSKVGSQSIAYTNNKNQGFTYDSAGNTTNDGIHTYSYNAENQQTVMDGGAATYAYDGEGRRMKKYTSSETTYAFYGPGGLLCEFTTTNTGATAAGSSDKTLYRTSEKTGSAVLIFNTSGTVLENNRTMPYGEEWLSDVASSNDKKFTTYDRDKESGLDYAMARMYANTGGRFTSPDQGEMTIETPISLNRYLYSAADPVNFEDPSGNMIPYLIFYPPVPTGGVSYQAPSGNSAAPVGAPNGPVPLTGKASAQKICNPSNNGVARQKQEWILAHYGEALSVATKITSSLGLRLGTNEALAVMFLQWSAEESGYGENAANKAQNNFFGIQNKTNAAGLYGGTTVACQRGGRFNVIAGNSQNACFASNVSWGTELGIALGITSSKTGVTYLNALTTALSKGADMAGALQAIADNGWNGPGYGKRITSTIDIQGQVDCLRSNGGLK